MRSLIGRRFRWIEGPESMRVILVLYYFVWLLPVSLAGRLLGHDPLQLRRPNAASYWLARSSTAENASYFSEISPAEGLTAQREDSAGAAVGASQLALVPLLALARLWAPPRTPENATVLAAAERNEAIPDEIYTLW